MKNEFLLFAIVIVALFYSTNSMATEKKADQTIYYGGDIITMEGEKAEYAEAVVQENGKIVFVGSKADAIKKYKTAGKHDLKGQTMMPGHIEPHLHPSISAILLSGDIVAP
ncbi:MAG: amidohydrolase, partial [Proteobacteria bacterium]|nr:amidohydrolase [Pseudomonadota bacterium]